MKNKCPYLTISGKNVELQQKYYRVSAIDGDIRLFKASNENNVSGYCYFLKLEEAELYSQLVILSAFTSKTIKNIENKCLGK